jgi:uncharacterized membrane protein YuzA (DUF378 family)
MSNLLFHFIRRKIHIVAPFNLRKVMIVASKPSCVEKLSMTTSIRDLDAFGPIELDGGIVLRRMNTIDWIAMILLIIGGINWGLVGLFQMDLVAALFGARTMLSRTVYTLVGISALYELIRLVLGEPVAQTADNR